MRKVLQLSVIMLWAMTSAAQHATDTFRLYFDLDVPTLSASAARKIDLLIYNDKLMPGSGVVIVGYADFLGTEGHNKTLSMERAVNVKKYLEHNGIDGKNIRLCVGKGEIERRGVSSPDGYPTDRRVDIVVDNHGNKGHDHTPIAAKTPQPQKKGSPAPQKAKRDTTNIGDIAAFNPGQIMRLRNVYFLPETHKVRHESYQELERLYTALVSNPKLKISIEGHVCCIEMAPDAEDIDTHELKLSVNRARAIYDYLVNKGIDSSRLRYEGFGKSRPIIAHERNEDDADKNRRVEIRILAK
jgi:outer membrane protein OmpA-like peptidoglycan-associated protein